MSHILRKLRYNKIFFAMLILCAIMLPSIIYKTSESDRIAITVMLAIDKTENNEVELSIMYLTPQSSNDVNKSYTIATTIAETVENAISEIQLLIGKEVGLSHTQAIIFSTKIAEDNPLKYFDVFTRTNRLTTNALIILSESPKDLLTTHLEQSTKQSVSLISILEYNRKNSFVQNMNLEQFYSEYFDESGISLVPIINVEDNSDSSGQEDQSGGGGSKNSAENNEKSANSASGNEEQSSSSQSKEGTESAQGAADKEINNTGDIAVFEKGKLRRIIKKDDVSILNLLSGETEKSFIKIENVTNKFIKNADLYIGVRKKIITTNCDFVNGYPVYTVNLSIACQLNEIIADEYTLNSISVVDSQIGEITKSAIRDKIQEDYSKLINIAKEENIDIFTINKNFHRLWTKEWAEYLLQLDTDDNFMQKVLFLINVDVIDNG